MEFSVWVAYFMTSWAISLSPGPAMVASLSSGLTYGARATFVQTLGLVVGIFVQIAIIAVGLGAVIVSSPDLFSVIKFVGGGYLIWVGIGSWRSKSNAMLTARLHAQAGNETGINLPSLSSRFVRGMMVNATNPKGVVFFLALTPPFIDPNGIIALQYAMIAMTTGFTDLCVMSVAAMIAEKLVSLLRTQRQAILINKAFGAAFMAAGLFVMTVSA